MNILLCSVPFRPSVGGIETVSAILLEQLRRAGHRVTLVTQTAAQRGAGQGTDDEERDIVRQPSGLRLFELVRSADVVFHNNISLRLAWPLLVLRRPWVVAHHIWLAHGARPTLAARAKRFVLRFASHVAVSRSLADSLPVPCAVVPNPYAEDVFHRQAGAVQTADLIFVGRLIADKGVAVLLDALASLRDADKPLRLTIVGSGPQETELRERALALGLGERVTFTGPRVGAELVALLNAHPVLVVPSVWEEPFGVVVLEGLACGCVPIVARSGGLPEAVGECGLVVTKGDPQAWARAMAELSADGEMRATLRQRAPAHLARHRPERIARDYLDLIGAACAPSNATRFA